ncbi:MULTISPECIES: carbon storage regulator CsrA [Paenibacillus]|uniref:Translational regulator CsrA n=1 Tax=Paenibacillus alvei TaxID=44250 RepID=A0AAP7DJ38_PAEAL|nr:MULTISPECIES: carbon storage regulator CsrA [Paenibacillus]EJW18408.1 carbon storage regulator CsrA [Paenibacillus alvei DSM 29]MEC0081078.1 carbon storage regulator CsrA [Paenibacillus alvei]NEZ43345.1 carbon storage regulator CsrA [Paenibacillus alvei]NOJ71271.1 carbon storage regulator CsrA [Paenibacillus alvei]
MLVLTRAKGQKIMIGQDIVLTVVEVNGDQVRLGIDAPSDISVYREEIFQSIKEQNEIAAKSDLSKEQLEVLKMMLKKKS